MDGRIFTLQKNLSERLSHAWTVREMARCFDLSIPHLQKLFKTQVGIPPISYLRESRLERARELLQTTFMQVKQIGIQTGMPNDSHFTRDFKKRYGMTPTNYRKSCWEIEQSTPPDGSK